MAVVYVDEKSAIIDHESWIMELIRKHKFNLREDEPSKYIRIKFQDLFDLRTPYLMDGQAEKVARELEGDGDPPTQPAKKKKKKEHGSQNEEECEAEVNHIMEVFTSLQLRLEFKCKFQFVPKADDYRSNNKQLRDLRKRFTEVSITKLPQLDNYYGGSEFDGHVVNGIKYMLPPGVRYVSDDVAAIKSHLSKAKFDLVVMDPPWQNKYVRRRTQNHGIHHGYSMMTVREIVEHPVGDLLHDGALLVIWCTNNSSLIQELVQALCVWDVQLVATWYWLKITKAGELITPLKGAGHGKRPYERVLLARKISPGIVFKDIPDGLVFCSVPCGIHSHKPPLEELLKEYIAEQARCLELFARSLIPGWTSYGLEVLRLQHSFLYEDSDKDG
ncbi:N(6)-adenine-specific methyltransferase METTL4 [Procambarus clarkii]|uniref:N(6)-adenine-specific methyltransferase METTL4 n=1 Tax=Procambarus clarkii TaxID=6728 RepID=UPI003742EBA0